ncbi:MAG: phosphopyruvate hydratase, partial [Parcubacteria group bacterium CG_4_10_14_0_8_um_filter_35_7]
TLKKILTKKGYSVAVGDEGGFAPKLKTNQEPFELIIKAIKQTGYKPEEEIGITIDAAATSFYLPKKNRYEFRLENKLLTRNELIDLYSKWIEEFPIVAIEDGLQEEDWEGWRKMYKKLSKRIQLIGDDFLVTNVKRLKRAIQKKCANSILIKPNQIGTLTETLDCIKMAHENNWKTMVSHRSGETIDTIIADLAVGTNAGQIKSGSLSRGERVCKYNRLMEIEEEIKDG